MALYSNHKVNKGNIPEEDIYGKPIAEKDVSPSKPHYRKTYDYIRARKLNDDVTVLDFETTGFNQIDDRIIQIGAIKYRDGNEIDRFSTYVNPEVTISQEITDITGITNKDVEYAPTIQEVIHDLHAFLQHETIVAHNAAFDMKFLLENFKKYNIIPERFRVIDTLSLSRKYIHATDDHKLPTLKKYLDLEATSHDAIEDCIVTGNLYYHIKNLQEKE